MVKVKQSHYRPGQALRDLSNVNKNITVEAKLISRPTCVCVCVCVCVYIQSNLSSRMPWIMNNSVYEQIFRTQSVSDDVLCLELRTRKSSKRRPKTNHTGQLFSETEAQWV